MKAIAILFTFFISTTSYAQKHTPLPHGMVFGITPNTLGMMDASKIEAFMGKRARTNATLRGKVIRVTKQKGGWFDLDAGKGKVIAAHFKNYNINIPASLKGRVVIVEGVAAKQFIADDLQHFAGDTVTGKKQHYTNADPKRRLTFEVTGLFVDH
jgi:hypothetical protein